MKFSILPNKDIVLNALDTGRELVLIEEVEEEEGVAGGGGGEKVTKTGLGLFANLKFKLLNSGELFQEYLYGEVLKFKFEDINNQC